MHSFFIRIDMDDCMVNYQIFYRIQKWYAKKSTYDISFDAISCDLCRTKK